VYSKSEIATKYLRYLFTASNSRGHGIHSPFVFDFIIHVLNDKREFYAFREISTLRKTLHNDLSVLMVDDFGAGSALTRTNERSVSQIAKHAGKSAKWGKMLFKLVNHYQPKIMIELGTSLGLSTAYLAAADPEARVVTLEGANSVAERARRNFQSLGLGNVEVVTGEFDLTLPHVLERLSRLDLAFIDGNHRKEPTIQYFSALSDKCGPDSLIIVDDIHWSLEMEEAWESIKNDPRVMLTVDLFFMGIVFYRQQFKVKQHFIIRF